MDFEVGFAAPTPTGGFESWPPLIEEPKRGPADLAVLHAMFSQPGSQASGSSSAENSSCAGSSVR